MANKRDVEMWRGQVRIPEPLADWIKERAKQSYRSLNAEFVEVVREAKQAAEARNAAR
jgi:hypothetical protein